MDIIKEIEKLIIRTTVLTPTGLTSRNNFPHPFESIKRMIDLGIRANTLRENNLMDEESLFTFSIDICRFRNSI